MANSNIRIFIIILLVLVVAAILFMLPKSKTNSEAEESSPEAVKTEITNTKPTIATEWIWQDSNKNPFEVTISSSNTITLPYFLII